VVYNHIKTLRSGIFSFGILPKIDWENDDFCQELTYQDERHHAVAQELFLDRRGQKRDAKKNGFCQIWTAFFVSENSVLKIKRSSPNFALVFGSENSSSVAQGGGAKYFQGARAPLPCLCHCGKKSKDSRIHGSMKRLIARHKKHLKMQEMRKLDRK